MKYKYIELFNYAGIYNGMGLNQIKIDFTRCLSNKIIIRGQNGSGKSTLMKSISPLSDSNDSFIPGMEARKIVCLTDNGIDYIIRYIHPVTNTGRGTCKGYISKMIDGQMVELNPNGNVTSCKEILYNEFNLDSNYLSLSKLSSEDRGLVDSRPAERKKLVNSIISSLETYNNINKKLSKKASVYKESINNLTYKINGLGNETTLQISKQNIESRLDKLEQEKNETLEAIAAVKIKISQYVQILKDNNYDQIVADLKDTNNKIKGILDSVNRRMVTLQITDRSKIVSFRDYIQAQLVKLRLELQSYQAQIPVMLAQRDAESANLEEKRQKLNGLQSEYNYVDLMNSIKYLEEHIAEYQRVFDEMKLKNINLITKDEFDAAMEALKYLKESAIALTSNYAYDDIETVINRREATIKFISGLQSYKIRLNELKQTESDLNRALIMFESKREIVAELSNRPENCTIDSCPYIASAVKANKDFPQDKMDALSYQLEEVQLDIKVTQDDINCAQIQQEILAYVSNIERSIKSNMTFIRKLPVRSDFVETFMQRLINFDKFEDIDALYAYVDCGNMIEQYKVESEQLAKFKSEYKVYESKNELIEQILNDIQSITEKVDSISNDMNHINSQIEITQKAIAENEDAETKVNALIDLIDNNLTPLELRSGELTNIKSSLDDNTSELAELQTQLEELNKNLGNVDNDIHKLTEEKERISHGLIMLTDYKNELAKYQNEYKKIDRIKYYSSSSTGIQTLYMQLYMNKIITTANELLSLLFDGEFMLQPFVINENEFRIPCLGNGLLHDDISSMSTAQKSMISLILSFSILHQSATRYNVLFLDELDGGLDTSNRSYFITLLDQLMNMLQCEQCFIISHNNELNTATADLIVLKSGPNENYTGNIIWKY